MKTKTSLTLSEDLIEALDGMTASGVSRSAFIERILREFVERREQASRDAQAVAAINRHAQSLNAEMRDSLSFQTAFGAE